MIKFALINTPTFNTTKPDKRPQILVPDVEYLSKFMLGSLTDVTEIYHSGFEKRIKINKFMKNAHEIDSIETLEIFLKACDMELKEDINSYIKGNEIVIKEKDLNITNVDYNSGISALQRAVIQAIFESQKPYIEIVKLAIENFMVIEDIIANVLVLGGKSMHPTRNAKALNYKKNKEHFISEINKLNTLVTDESLVKVTNDNSSNNNDSGVGNSNNTSNSNIEKIITTEYSTGEYIEGIDYDYIYKYINEININTDELDRPYLNLDYLDSDDNRKEKVIFGVFDTNGRKLSEDEVPQWIKDSSKWVGQFEQLENYSFIWRKGNQTKIQFDSPGIGWLQQLYTEGTEIDGVIYDVGEPMIVFKEDEVEFRDIIENSYRFKLEEESDDQEIVNEIMDMLSYTSETTSSEDISTVDTHIDYLIRYCYLKVYDGRRVPMQKKPFLPKKVIENGVEIMIDPEMEYDKKIIKVKLKENMFPEYYGSNSSGNDIDLYYREGYRKQAEKNIELLTTDELYSDGEYGEDENMTLDENLSRYKEYSGDNTIYYIIEGIYSEDNPKEDDDDEDDSDDLLIGGGRKKKNYKKPWHFFKVIPKFIKLLVRLATKLFPTIMDVLNLLSNPSRLPNFITNALISKIGDNNGTEAVKFDMFSKPFLSKLNNLYNAIPSKRQDIIDSNELLSKYVYLDGYEPKLVIEGNSSIDFIGILFSITSEKFNFDADIIKPNFDNIVKYVDEGNFTKATKLIEQAKNYSKIDFNIDELLSNVGFTYLEGMGKQPTISFILEMMSMPLKAIKEVINEILKFFKSLTNPKKVLKKTTEFLTFKWLEKILKIENILKLLGLKFDTNKYKEWTRVAEVVEVYTIEDILNLTNNSQYIGKSLNFIYTKRFEESMEWVNELGAKQTYTLDELLNSSLRDVIINDNSINNKKSLELYNKFKNNNPNMLFDMSEIMSCGFMSNMPIYDLASFRENKINIISSILKSFSYIIESIINSFIDFVWALFGLGRTIRIPHIELDSIVSVDDNEIEKIESLKDIIIGGETISIIEDDYYYYIYDIETSSNVIYTDLYFDEMIQIINENKYDVIEVKYKKN